MKIQICSWMRDSLEKKHGYDEETLIDGDSVKAFEVARDLFDKGLNLKVQRALFHGELMIRIWIDTKAFSQS